MKCHLWVYSLGDILHFFLSCYIWYTEMEMSLWWNFHYWLHQNLSFWQLISEPVMKISLKWQHFYFSVLCINHHALRFHCIPVDIMISCHRLDIRVFAIWDCFIDPICIALSNNVRNPCNKKISNNYHDYHDHQQLWCTLCSIDTLGSRQNGPHFADDTFKCIFMNENARIPI